MQPYKNLGGNSGVTAFDFGPGDITVQFRNSTRLYTYSTKHISSQKIEHMKALAIAGQGLNTFISQNKDVHDGFDR